RDQLRNQPSQLDFAQQLWEALGDYDGSDIRSGKYVLDIFRVPALFSYEGVIALARAYKSLHEESGESPPPRFDDEQLTLAIKHSQNVATGDEKRLLSWLWDAEEDEAN